MFKEKFYDRVITSILTDMNYFRFTPQLTQVENYRYSRLLQLRKKESYNNLLGFIFKPLFYLPRNRFFPQNISRQKKKKKKKMEKIRKCM